MTTLHVTFRVGQADYAVAARDVLHLEAFEAATRVPGTPDYVAGLMQTRGRLLPVVDLRARFGLPPLAGEAELAQRRVVIVQHQARTAALLVDRAREVVQLDEAAFEPPPELIEQQAGGFVRAVASTAKRLLLLIDVPSVLGEELTR